VVAIRKSLTAHEALRSILGVLLGPRIVTSHQPTIAIAQRDRPVRVLGYQGLIQPPSNVHALLALTFSIDVNTHFCLSASLFQHFVDCGQQCDRRDTRQLNLRQAGKGVLIVTKKNPEARMPGVLQVVASACRLLCPGGGDIWGMGTAVRMRPTKSQSGAI
jgi:hypothetical protein